MLRLAGTDQSNDDKLRPIPFPRHRVAGRRADGARHGRPDTGRLVEEAIEDVQARLDELDAILDEPLPFPGRDADGDDRPPAA
jgi:hypothetical protein